jgi:long-chain acyl-CoA synthetase
VRSAQAEREELLFILAESGSIALVVEDRKTLKKLRDRLDSLPIQLVVLLSDEEPSVDETLKVVNFSQVIAAGPTIPYSQLPKSGIHWQP